MKTKIVATIGPASSSFSVLKRMKKAGMDIGRINTKYASREDCVRIQKMLRKLGCKVLVDIIGTKMLPFLKDFDFDYLAVSFAESEKQLSRIRDFFEPRKVFIIAKIETKKGIKNIDRILMVSDGLMVARGDLGNNIPLEKLPVFQKKIIKKCSKAKRFDITATEMLLSMVNSKTPTRAEVTDVANAVLDGSDAVMLSEETAIGKYPVEAVEMMKKIIRETEKFILASKKL